MSAGDGSSGSSSGKRITRAVQVVIVSSVMFTFISYWRTAAVVLCDLASTSYYIGGIVENAIGPAAPFYILAVMVFSYAVRSVYIESSSLFVRGGVYRVVKEAMGGFLAKLSVSALMFDYILTGPTSGVSAGSYIMRLLILFVKLLMPGVYNSLDLDSQATGETGDLIIKWGAVAIACGITVYFFRQNLLGIHESSDKALKIMIATTIMAAIMLTWCLLTVIVQGAANPVPWQPDLNKKWEHAERAVNDYSDLTSAEKKDAEERRRLFNDEENPVNIRDLSQPDHLKPQTEDGHLVPKGNEALKKVGIETQDDPIGFLGRYTFFDFIRVVGFLGLFIAFGHSILAMSGEETLAQVYREVEAPKLKNFKRAAFIVFVYSLVLTAGISFLAVLLIPDEVRMKYYQDNLIGGLARHVIGPTILKLFLETFVVVVGFLILAGAVNTAIIGSNGVLNRIAEDGVLPDWFLKPHPRYGTTFRLLVLIAGLQIVVILFSRGDMVVLGEAYAFGVVWSFVFKALSMVVLRFKDRTPREYKVPLNLKIGNVELPIGLGLIFLVLLITALLNLFTKEVATVSGIVFTALFLTIFLVSEHYHEKRRREGKHAHLEQFNRRVTPEITAEGLGLKKPYHKLVAIRSPHNLFMLEKALNETDPHTTDVVVMTAKMEPKGGEAGVGTFDLDVYDQQLMTAVVDKAERVGKKVIPLIVPTNHPLHAVLRTAKDLKAQELILGASNKFTADEQLEQIAFYWISLHDGSPTPLTVRILSRTRDVYFDLEGGNRIPKISERHARSVAELRAAGVGVDRVLLVHSGTSTSSDLFWSVLTMLDPQVILDVAAIGPVAQGPPDSNHLILQDQQRARQLGREVAIQTVNDNPGPELVHRAREGLYDLIVLISPDHGEGQDRANAEWVSYIVKHAHCPVFLAVQPEIPKEVDE